MLLNRGLNQKLTLHLCHPLNRRPDGRKVRPKDPVKEICTLLERYLRLRNRAARRDPHLFGPHAQKYYQDTIRMEQEQRDIDAALDRVYGRDTNATSAAETRHSVWAERYYIPPEQQQFFRKWFRRNYGS